MRIKEVLDAVVKHETEKGLEEYLKNVKGIYHSYPNGSIEFISRVDYPNMIINHVMHGMINYSFRKSTKPSNLIRVLDEFNKGDMIINFTNIKEQEELKLKYEQQQEIKDFERRKQVKMEDIKIPTRPKPSDYKDDAVGFMRAVREWDAFEKTQKQKAKSRERKKKVRNTILYFLIAFAVGGVLMWIFSDFLSDNGFSYKEEIGNGWYRYEYIEWSGYVVAILSYIALTIAMFFIYTKSLIAKWNKLIAKWKQLSGRTKIKALLVVFSVIILYLFALNFRYTHVGGHLFFDKWTRKIVKIEREYTE